MTGWALLWPLTRIVRRDPRLVLFFGRDGGRFLDNCKHLYAQATQRGASLLPVYLAADQESCGRLRALGGRAEIVSSLRATWLWLRAGTIVVDSVDWSSGMRFAGSRGARIVQLWHGVPLKQVQMGRISERRMQQPAWERALFSLYLWIVGRLAPVDWFLSTSRHVTEHAFARSFRYRSISHAGYPRNDVLFAPGNPMAEACADERAREAMSNHLHATRGGKVVLYAPTFREALDDPFASGRINLPALSELVVPARILLLVKLHPWMHDRFNRVHLPGIVFVAPDSDVYPLMREADALVTDYSSIFFDYLLLDRPIVFFPYDLDRYLGDERPMYFDYESMTPGPKAGSVPDLGALLEAVAAGKDEWQAQRQHVRDLVFDHPGPGAANRLLDELFPVAQ